MAQVFHPSTNTLSKASISGVLLVLVLAAWIGAEIQRSPAITEVDVARAQPVPFSHEHHVSGLGIDCRYCHSSAQDSAFAGIPSTKTCMTCHSQIWIDAGVLQPVRESWSTGAPLEWTRVHDLPDFVYFHHGIHVSKGIGCSTCHGRVDRMPLLWKERSLYMEWCLDCHRSPEKHVRPREEVLSMDWKPPPGQEELGRKLLETYRIRKAGLTDCSLCHR